MSLIDDLEHSFVTEILADFLKAFNPKNNINNTISMMKHLFVRLC